MKIVLLVLAILVLLCVLIGSIRVGGIVEYSEDGVLALLRLGPVKIQLYPSRPRRKKKKKEKKKKPDKDAKSKSKKKKADKDTKSKSKKKTEKKKESGQTAEIDGEKQNGNDAHEADDAEEPEQQESAPSKRGGRLALLKELLPVGIEALGDFKRRLCIDELTLDYTIPGRSDPARAAIFYGQLCAGGGAVAALLENNFTVKRRRFSAQVDFLQEHALIYARASLSFTIGQLVCMAICYGWKALRIFLRIRKQNQPQEVRKNGKQASDQ